MLRYGAFYGPGTSLAPGEEQSELVRKRKFPLVGDGGGVWSFIHIADAAEATVAAVEHGKRGVYNVVDDDPAPVAEWLPALAQRARREEADARAAVRRAAVRRRGRRGDDDRAPRCFERQSQARARLAAGTPELAGGVRSGMTDRERLLDELRPAAFAIAYRMLGSVVRGRGRRAGGAAAGPSGARRGRADRLAARVRRHGDDPAGDQRAALRAGPPRALRRRVAARADHHRRPRRPGRSTPRWPTRCRWPCWCCWRASRRSSAPCCCCTTCSTTGIRRSRRSSGRARTTCASSRPAPDATSSSGGRASRRPREQRDELARRFFAAAEDGDLAGLEALLAHDVVLTGDGGGKVPALARTLHGRNRVARDADRLVRLGVRLPGVSMRPVGGQRRPGRALSSTGSSGCSASWALDIADGRITQHQLGGQPRQARAPRAGRGPGLPPAFCLTRGSERRCGSKATPTARAFRTGRGSGRRRPKQPLRWLA